MADNRLIWDLDRPTPNIALERIRQELLAGEDAYLLIDMLLGLLDTAAIERDELRSLLGALQGQVAALDGRLAALEPPTVPDLPEEIL